MISLKDEVEKVGCKRQEGQERLRRLGRVYVDGVYYTDEYRRQKRLLETEPESLMAPEVTEPRKRPSG